MVGFTYIGARQSGGSDSLPEDEPKKLETCRRQQKLRAKYKY
jgi:hypothetical protein